jgi:sulfoxide reductase heme-binding subunit YedZ
VTGSTAFWYASRATGIVALLLLTAVLVVGLVTAGHGRIPGMPRFAVTNLHRNLSLLAVTFIVVHVLTAVLDGYVKIPLLSAVMPFTSGYERFWLGLGATAFDLMLALIVTSLIRARLNRPVWRAVHLLAYVSWPVAVMHGIGASPDLRHGKLLDLVAFCLVAALTGLGWRLARAARGVPRAGRVADTFAQYSAARTRRGSR